MINYHAGITPKYRGQQPAYWALTQDDAENAGITVHLVDTGVDTGSILYQEKSNFAPQDNITTYQQFQMGHAVPLMIKAINDALQNKLAPKPTASGTGHWFPPTIWQYVYNGLRKGVW
jgi:methionyl-tRNA formyltransferase